MAVEIIWTLPKLAELQAGQSASERGSQGRIRDVRGDRFGPFDRLLQIARGAEAVGLDGVWAPHDDQGLDAWVSATAIARETRRLTLIVDFNSAFGSPVYAAKMTATAQRFSNARFEWSLSDQVGEEAQTARDEEFLAVASGVWRESPFTFKGRFFEVAGGGFDGPLAGLLWPQVHLAGGDAAKEALAARHADIYLLSGLHPDQTASERQRLTALATAAGRRLQFAAHVTLATASEADHDEERAVADLQAHIDAGVTRLIVQGGAAVSDVYAFGQNILPHLRRDIVAQQAA